MIATALPRAWYRRPRLLIVAVAFTLSLFLILTGLATAADRLIDPWRFAATARPARGAITIVELDAASLATIRRWPWSRKHHARLVDRLVRAGAASIVFDVDFSAASDVAGDAAFARALAASGGRVVLPTFGQQAASGDTRSLDSLPLPAFRSHATLASVNIAPDSDGIVRRAPIGTVTDGQPRPSLAALIAGRDGTADTFYPIDFGIDPQTIPRLSFVAVEQGRFDPAAVRGRQVLIGATSIELGDRFGTPRWGVIPGVVIQALGAETLFRGVPVEWSDVWPLLAAVMLSIAIVRARSMVAGAAATLIAAAVLIGGALFLHVKQIDVPVAAALILIASTAAGRISLSIVRRFIRQQLTDSGTGLPNRRALITAPVPAAMQTAVLRMTDYDSLSAILGDAADRDLPRRVADRLAHAAQGGQVWRVADRLLAFHLPAEVEAEDVLAGLRAVMLQPIEVNGHRVDVTVTVGVADGSGDQAITEAALTATKAQVEGVFWRRGKTDVDALGQQMSMMGELDAAITLGQIEVHYQPKLALETNAVASCEALVRWRHPTRGMIRPDLFIPQAEHSDRIAPLTLHVIELAMRDLAAWRAAGHRLTVAVNISATLLSSPSFDASVRALIAAGPVPAETLVFEVTESATIADPQAAAATLEGYRALGIAISMDDYGTGQSTLSYLRRLPLSELKIDRSFVQHAHRNRADAVLVRSTIDMAHELGLKVVAEGVEDAECLDLLRAFGCDMVQGYLISRPVPAPAFAALLEGPRAEAA